MLCSVYTTIAGEYDGPPFCTPIGRMAQQCWNRNAGMPGMLECQNARMPGNAKMGNSPC